MQKKGKRITNDNYEGFTTTYGTVDYTTNKSVYIDISSWLEPLVEDDPKLLTSLLKKTIKNSVYEVIPTSPFLSHYIVDLDLRESGMRLGKKSFMSCDITLYTNVDLPNVTEDIHRVVDRVIEAVRDRFNDIFVFNKKKKP